MDVNAPEFYDVAERHVKKISKLCIELKARGFEYIIRKDRTDSYFAPPVVDIAIHPCRYVVISLTLSGDFGIWTRGDYNRDHMGRLVDLLSLVMHINKEISSDG